MLRLMFVLGIVLAGVIASTQGPFYALLFYLWNAYFRPEDWVWADWILSLRLSFTIGIVLVIGSLSSLSKFKWTAQLILVVLFLAQATLSLVLSEYTAQAFPFWLDFAKTLIVSLLMTVLVTDGRRFRMALWVIAWSLGFEMAKQGWAQLVLNPGAVNSNTNMMLGDNNGIAMGMMMLLPLLMALAQTSTTRIERYIHYFVAVGVAYRGISTYSRGGFLAAGAVFVLTLMRSQHRIRTLAATALVAGVLFSAMPASFWHRMDTIDAASEDRDASAQSRLYYWGLAWQMAKDHPIAGVGFNAFRFEFPRYDRSNEGYRAAHSIWFATMTDLGFPGLILFAAIAVSALVTCQRLIGLAQGSGLTDIRLYASHLQTTAVAYIVGGTFLSAHYLEFWWHIVMLTATLRLVYERQVQQGLPTVVPTAVEPLLAMPIVMPNIPARLRRPDIGATRRAAGRAGSREV